MARTSTDRRRSNLILKRLQGRILLQTTLFPVGVIAVLATAIVVLGRRLMAIADEAGAPMPDLGPMLHGIVFLSAAMAAAIFYVSYRVSHRIAGPAWRVIQSLRRIREGDAAFQVKLRKGDMLLQVVDELNTTLTTLEQRFAAETARTAPAAEAGQQQQVEADPQAPVAAGQVEPSRSSPGR